MSNSAPTALRRRVSRRAVIVANYWSWQLCSWSVKRRGCWCRCWWSSLRRRRRAASSSTRRSRSPASTTPPTSSSTSSCRRAFASCWWSACSRWPTSSRGASSRSIAEPTVSAAVAEHGNLGDVLTGWLAVLRTQRTDPEEDGLMMRKTGMGWMSGRARNRQQRRQTGSSCRQPYHEGGTWHDRLKITWN